MLNGVIKRVADSLPDMNDYLLKDYREEQINQATDYIQTVFSEALRLFKGHDIESLSPRVMTPEERVRYESKSGLVNVMESEWVLVEFSFRHGKIVHKTPIYIPYLFGPNRMIMINDTLYNIMLTVGNKVFNKIKDGVSAKVIRSPIKFWKRDIRLSESVTSGKKYLENVITVKIHNKVPKRTKKIFPTVVHYLLLKYPLKTVLKIFDIGETELSFVSEINKSDTDLYEYFEARARTRSKDNVYMKVSKTLLEPSRIHQRRVVNSLLYTLTYFKRHTVRDLYDPSSTVYKIMMGKIIHGMSTADAIALNYMENHIETLESYLDPINQKTLSEMGIFVNNIYDLLIYVFRHIDEMTLESHSDLFEKRIDVLDTLLVETLVKSIYYQFYNFENRMLKSKPEEVSKALYVSAYKIGTIHNSKHITMSPSRYNDNWLLGVGGKKIRQSSFSQGSLNAPEHRFHLSFPFVESPVAFSQNQPGISGSINPFLEIDSDGSIIKPDYIKKLEHLNKYLPYK